MREIVLQPGAGIEIDGVIVRAADRSADSARALLDEIRELRERISTQIKQNERLVRSVPRRSGVLI